MSGYMRCARAVIILLAGSLAGSHLATAQTGVVQGQVWDVTMTEPLAGVSVVMEETTQGTITGPDGRFVILGVPLGEHSLAASRLGFRTSRVAVSVRDGEPVEVTLILEEQPIEIPEIVVERVMLTGGRTNITDIPGDAHYVGPRELERFRYNDIQRILQDVPGVNIQEEDGYGLRPNIGLRGTGVERSSKITLMEDGVLMAPAPYAAPSAYYFPTAGRMQAVEVRKGSSQIKYGPYTTGGAINLISTQIPDQFRGHITVQTGDYNDRGLHAVLGHSLPQVGFLLETYQAQTDGFKLLQGGGDTGFDKKDFMAKVRFNSRPDASVQHAVTLKAFRADESSDETYLGLTDIDFQRTPFMRYAGSQKDVMDAGQRHYIARYVVRPTSYLDVTTTLYRTEFHRDWYKLDRVRVAGNRAKISAILADPASHAAEMALLKGATSTGADGLELKHNNRTYFAQGFQSVIGLQLAGSRLAHDIEVGIRIHRDEIDRFQWVDLYRMTDGVMSMSAAGAPGTESNRVEEASAVAVHSQYALQAGRLRIVPGARFEHITLSRLDYGKEDPGRTGADLSTRSNTVTAFIPGIGVDFAVRDSGRLFGGIHKGFAPPGSKEDTNPEESINYEIGARFWQDVFFAEAVVFYSDYDNLLGANLAAVGEDGVTDQFNGGAVHTRGLEASLGTDFGAAVQGNISIPARMAYTYTKATFQHAFDSDYGPWGAVEKGDELPYLPRHRVSGNIGLETTRYATHLSFRYTTPMRVTAGQGALVEAHSTDAHFVVDLAAHYRLTQRVNIFASVRNLTDATYIVARRPAGVRPGLPRLMLIGFKVDF